MDSRAYHRNQNAEERTRKTLVTAAPKYGATAEIAQAIADALRDYGLDPTVRTSKSSTSRPPHRSRISCNTTPGHGPSAEDLATYAGGSHGERRSFPRPCVLLPFGATADAPGIRCVL
jgi:hypothetical protein